MDNLLNRLTLLVGLTSSASLALSVIYDLGYFSVVGPQYFLFMSLSDHLSSLLPWLPPLVLAFCLLYVFWMLLLRRRDLSDIDGDHAPASFLASIRMFVSIGLTLIVYFLAILIFVVVLRTSVFITSGYIGLGGDEARFSADSIFLAFGVIASFVVTGLMITSSPRRWMLGFVGRLDPSFLSIVVIVFALSGTYFLGRVVAIGDLTRPSQSYELVFFDGDSHTECRDCKVLRSYSRGILVFSVSGERVSFVTNDVVMSVSRRVAGEGERQSVFGWIFDFGESLEPRAR